MISIKRVFNCAFLMALFGGVFVHAAPPPKVLHLPPAPVHLDLEAGILIALEVGAYCVYDLSSNKMNWSFPNPSRGSDMSIDMRNVALTRGDAVFVYDRFTGRERWHSRESSPGGIEVIQYLGDSGWLAAVLKAGNILYAPDGRRHPVPSEFVRNGRTGIAGVMPEEGIVALVQFQDENRASVYFWNLALDTIEEGYPIESLGWMEKITSEGAFWYVERDTKPDAYWHVCRDAHTGAIQKRVAMPESYCGYTEGMFIARGEKGNALEFLEEESGALGVRLESPAHRFFPNVYARKDGKLWVASVDTGGSIWLWPVEAGAVPKKVVEHSGERFLPGIVEKLRPPYMFTNSRRGSIAAYRLDTLEQAAEWPLLMKPHHVFDGMVSANLARACTHYWIDHEENVTRTHIVEAGKPEAFKEFPDYAIAISADGRYAVFQDAKRKGPAALVEVDSGAACARISPEEEGQIRAAFAAGTRHVAVASAQRAVLIALEEGYPQQEIVFGEKDFSMEPLAFSPDGKLIATQGVQGKAFVYDVESGGELGCFVEPERVASRYQYPGEGFLERTRRFAEHMAKDIWNGPTHVPRLRSYFSADSRRLITSAEGEILRIWDIASGKQVHVLYTGLTDRRDERGHISNTAILSENGAYALAYNRDGLGDAYLLDLDAGKLIRQFALPPGDLRHIAVAEDGSKVYAVIDYSLYFLPGRK